MRTIDGMKSRDISQTRHNSSSLDQHCIVIHSTQSITGKGMIQNNHVPFAIALAVRVLPVPGLP
jgi:hypothetical protein